MKSKKRTKKKVQNDGGTKIIIGDLGHAGTDEKG
jgi:hypothetical protein